MKNDILNIPNYLHLSDPKLVLYEFHYIVINFISRFSWHFEIEFRPLLLEDFFCSTQKRHISEYVCKTCLEELGILLKYRETFKKLIATCNSSKNTGLSQFSFKGFWQLCFKNVNFLTKTKKWLYTDFYELKPN